MGVGGVNVGVGSGWTGAGWAGKDQSGPVDDGIIDGFEAGVGVVGLVRSGRGEVGDPKAGAGLGVLLDEFGSF